MARIWFSSCKRPYVTVPHHFQVFTGRSCEPNLATELAENARVGRPWVSALKRILLAAGSAAICLYEFNVHQSDEEMLTTRMNFSGWPQQEQLERLHKFQLYLNCQSFAWLTNENVRYVSLWDMVSSHLAASPSTEPQSYSKAHSKDDQRDLLTRYTIADAAAKAAPAVVHITVTIGEMGMIYGQGAGSGVIINSNGTILTNAHVVADYWNVSHKGKVKVSMQDGRAFDGEVVSFDTASDIAVVRIESKMPLPVANLGSSQKLRPGEWVVALGSPLHLQNSVTVGVVSCVERKSSEIGLRGIHGGYIQTDAAINQGNSGGPLLNLDGEVIGINTMKAFAADGVSFAIPIDIAIKVMEQLEKHGRVVRPWLGIKMLELNHNVLAQLKEQDPTFPDITEGVLVPQVIPGSPAERAGVRAGDVIVQFDGIPVSKASQIVDILGDKIGVSFPVLVKRTFNRPVTLIVTTEEAKANT